MNLESIAQFLSFIKQINNRPGMYGVNQVKDIALIIFGYRYSNNDEANGIDEFLTGFRAFVNVEFGTKEDFDWPKLIYLYSGSDSHSLQLFDKLFKSYTNKFG